MKGNIKIYPALLKRIIKEEKAKIILDKKQNKNKYIMIEKYISLLNKIDSYQKSNVNKKINEEKISAIKRYIINNISRRV